MRAYSDWNENELQHNSSNLQIDEVCKQYWEITDAYISNNESGNQNILQIICVFKWCN
jgi:hypothetical protein